MDRISKFVKKVYQIVRKPQMSVLPGQLAFFIVLSIIPLIALIGTIVAIFSVSNQEFLDLIYSVFPVDVADFIMPIMENGNSVISLITYFITTFLLASNGLYSMSIVANNIYNQSGKSYIKRRLKSIGLTFILVLSIIVLLIIPAFGESIFSAINTVIGQNRIVDLIYTLFQILGYPISICFIYINLRILYIHAPDKEIEQKNTRFGALFTTISWVIVTFIYSLWINNFTNYTEIYGYVANLIVLMLWIYLISYIFTIGLALNAQLEKSNKEKKHENN